MSTLIVPLKGFPIVITSRSAWSFAALRPDDSSLPSVRGDRIVHRG
jgi:hypothetical protein